MESKSFNTPIDESDISIENNDGLTPHVNELESLIYNDNLNSEDVTVEELPADYNGNFDRVSVLNNVPHMQLFHHLKQNFPTLRDSDINESIQKVSIYLLFIYLSMEIKINKI